MDKKWIKMNQITAITNDFQSFEISAVHRVVANAAASARAAPTMSIKTRQTQ